MGFEDIPEDREESFPCECGGDITRIDGKWVCSKCDFERKGKTKGFSKNEKFEK